VENNPAVADCGANAPAADPTATLPAIASA
jgi:hypothetical protein